MDIITAIVLVLVFITMEYSHNQVMKDCMKEIQYYREMKEYYREMYYQVLEGTAKGDEENNDNAPADYIMD